MCMVSIRKMFMMTGFLFLLFLVWVFFGAIVIQIYRDNLNWIDVVPYINQNVKKYDMWKINIIKKRHRKKMALIIFLSTFLTNDWHVLYCSSLIQRVFLLVKEKHYDDFYSPSSTNNHAFYPATWHCRMCVVNFIYLPKLFQTDSLHVLFRFMSTNFKSKIQK